VAAFPGAALDIDIQVWRSCVSRISTVTRRLDTGEEWSTSTLTPMAPLDVDENGDRSSCPRETVTSYYCADLKLASIRTRRSHRGRKNHREDATTMDTANNFVLPSETCRFFFSAFVRPASGESK
jgi:hypothetical protein